LSASQDFYDDPLPYDNDEPEDPYPTISNEEQETVDKWWSVYHKLENIDEIKIHLDLFLNQHPVLVENLGLEYEALFELGADYRRNERGGEYIEFLIDFRKRFPRVFAKSAGYYDFDIIAWQISQGKIDKVKGYLDNYIENPVKLIDKLYELIDLLLATNNTEEARTLIAQVAKNIIESGELIGCDDFADPLLMDAFSSYMEADFTGHNIQRFVQDLDQFIPFPIEKDNNIEEIWSGKQEAILRPFEQWPDPVRNEKRKNGELYEHVALNFMRYMKEQTNISWMSAQYYSDLIKGYLLKLLEHNQKMTGWTFLCSKKIMEEVLINVTQRMFLYIDCTQFMALLNGLHLFSDYLHLCGNLEAKDALTIQENCRVLWKKNYPDLNKNYFEASCFSRYPLFQGGTLLKYCEY